MNFELGLTLKFNNIEQNIIELIKDNYTALFEEFYNNFLTTFNNLFEFELEDNIVKNIYFKYLKNKKTSDNSDDLKYKVNPEKWYNSNYSWSDCINKVNKTVFKNNSFKPNQEAIINSILSDNDVFVCMPTGYGKSLIYEIVSLLKPPILVIYPLVSLINDQYNIMKFYGLKAFTYISGAKFNELIQIPDVQIILSTPEKIMNSKRNVIDELKINKIFIDEAHCISEWGSDFRKEYRQLGSLKANHNVNIIGLTATASDRVRNEIIKNLKLKDVQYFQSSFDRKNIFIDLIYKDKLKEYPEDGKKSDTIDYNIYDTIRSNFYKENGIIYVSSIKESIEISNKLNKYMKSSAYFSPFNSKLKEQDKIDIVNRWKNKDGIYVIVATISFGMGINHLSVRFIFHYNFPWSIENYYQEIGRAGRDGLNCYVKLYFSIKDKSFFDNIGMNNIKRDKLYDIILYCVEKFRCKRKIILNYFGENVNFNCCNFCSNCIYYNNLIRDGYTLEPVLLRKTDIIDITEPVKDLKKCTINNYIKILKQKHHNFSNLLQNFDEYDIIKLIFLLLKNNILKEITKGKKFKHSYIIFNNIPNNYEVTIEVLKEIKMSCYYINNNYNIKEINIISSNNNPNNLKIDLNMVEELYQKYMSMRIEMINIIKHVNLNNDYILNSIDLFFPIEIIKKMAEFIPRDLEELKIFIGYLPSDLDYFYDAILNVSDSFIKDKKLSSEDIQLYRDFTGENNNKNIKEQNNISKAIVYNTIRSNSNNSQDTKKLDDNRKCSSTYYYSDEKYEEYNSKDETYEQDNY